jgi:hypothetical protein
MTFSVHNFCNVQQFVIRSIEAPKELRTPLDTHISAALLSLFLSHVLKYDTVQNTISQM